MHGEDVGAAKPFRKQYRAITGFVCQFLYVGAQVTIGSFFLNYTAESAGISDAEGSNLLSYALILFTVGRFVGVALLSVISAPLLLCAYGLICTLLAILIGSLSGMSGVICLMMIMFFESIMYPVIFVTGTTGLGRHTRRASALLVMGVSGGAVFPPIQGAIADHFSTRSSYYLVVPCFLYIAGWAFWVWNKDGRQWSADGGEVEREIEAAAGGAFPPAHTSVNYGVQQENSNFNEETKDSLDHVEKV